MSFDYKDNFRPDGIRAACHDCRDMIDMKSNESIRECLERHYKEKHSKIWLKATAICNKIDRELEQEYGVKNATSKKRNV